MSRERGREKKEPRDNILEDIIFMIFGKTLVAKCLQCVKEPINWVEMNAIVLLRTNLLCKKEVINHISLIVSMFLSLSHCALGIFATGKPSTMDWKFLWIFIFLAANTYAKPQYLAEFYLHFNTIKLQK